MNPNNSTNIYGQGIKPRHRWIVWIVWGIMGFALLLDLSGTILGIPEPSPLLRKLPWLAAGLGTLVNALLIMRVQFPFALSLISLAAVMVIYTFTGNFYLLILLIIAIMTVAVSGYRRFIKPILNEDANTNS